DWAVRHQLAATLATFPAGSAGETALVQLLERNGDDPLTVDAALSGLSGREAAVLRRLLETPAETPQRAAVATTLAATVVKAGQDKDVQDLLKTVADSARPAWQREALLAGAEAALTGRALPGALAGRGNANAAAATNAALGARGGPGGNRAFPDQPNAAAGARAAGAGRGGGGGGGRAGGAGRGGNASV